MRPLNESQRTIVSAAFRLFHVPRSQLHDVIPQLVVNGRGKVWSEVGYFHHALPGSINHFLPNAKVVAMFSKRLAFSIIDGELERSRCVAELT